MLSKLLRLPCRYNAVRLLVVKGPFYRAPARKFLGLVYPTQYDTPYPKKLQLGYALRVYWETIPLFFVTTFALSLVVMAFMWASQNKVDVVFTTNSRRNISRTMDLRNPTVHKMVLIHQHYSPWPEMQDVLDKMATAEKRALVRMNTCIPS